MGKDLLLLLCRRDSYLAHACWIIIICWFYVSMLHTQWLRSTQMHMEFELECIFLFEILVAERNKCIGEIDDQVFLASSMCFFSVLQLHGRSLGIVLKEL